MALIVVSVMALVAGLVVGGVALAKWSDQNPGILRDECIAGHEVTELQVGDHNRETTLIRVRSGTTTADTLGLLKDLREHNRTAGSEGYIRRPRAGDPITYGELDRFSVTDLGDFADHSNDATSQQQRTIGLEI